MPLYKITHVFKSNIFGRPAGWTDVWYMSAADFTTANTQATALANARVQGLHQDFSLDTLRISDNIPVFPKPANRRTRHAALYEVNLGGSLGPAGEAALPGEAALIRVSNTDNTTFRNWELRGIPDRWWDQDQDKIAKTELNVFLNTFQAALAANQVFLLHRTRNPDAYTPVALVKCQYFRLTHKNTGRPLYLQRGRR
jgi:hypothetical protein